MIDRNAGRSFSARKLLDWKDKAEDQAAGALIKPGFDTQNQGTLKRMHYLQYVNVPRLVELLSTSSSSSLHQLAQQSGFNRNWIAPELHVLATVLREMEFVALELDDLIPPSDDIVGSPVRFEGRFRTRNGVRAGADLDTTALSHFDEKRSPFIYRNVQGCRVTMPYDPRWITTMTAVSDFRGGSRVFAGIAIVKSVDKYGSQIVCSPMVIGFPRNRFMDEFYGD